MSPESILKLKQEIDALINQHQLREARRRLKAIDPEALPLVVRSEFAVLCRRAHLYDEALKMLQDQVLARNPSRSDLLEYASSIRKIGMVHQCLRLLERIDGGKEKLLYQAFCHTHEWNYPEARRSFEAYLAFPQLNERERIVGQLNLISCLIFQDELKEASVLLEKTLQKCGTNHPHLALNCREMQAQVAIKQRDFATSTKILDEALANAQGEPGTTTLFLQKWKAVEGVAQTGAVGPASLEFKKIIRQQAHWETLRDFDAQLALYANQPGLLDYVYFGTPYPEFRKKLKLQHPHHRFSEAFVPPSERTPKLRTLLDPLGGDLPVRFGLIQHRLILLLLSDFYRPWTVQRIFDNLFRDEIYDPYSSPKRVYALIKKVQTSLKKAKLPFELISTINGYRFRQNDEGLIRIHDKMLFESTDEIIHFVIARNFKDKSFQVRELEDLLQLSKHKIYRLLRDLEAKDQVEKVPFSAKYQIKAS